MGQTIILFGNAAAVREVKDETTGAVTGREPLPGDAPRVELVAVPDSAPIGELFLTLTNPQRGLWAARSDKPPVWVACANQTWEAVLADHYGSQRGVPADLEETHWTHNGPPGQGPQSPETDAYAAALAAPGDAGFLRIAAFAPRAIGRGVARLIGLVTVGLLAVPMLRTAAGRDFQSRVMGDTASTGTSSYAAANYMALTENATAAADGDTTLSGELFQAGGGLNRKQCTYSHTAGGNSYALAATYTAAAADVLPKTPAKMGLFNAATMVLGGSMAFETLIPSPAPLASVGDQLTVTDTISLV